MFFNDFLMVFECIEFMICISPECIVEFHLCILLCGVFMVLLCFLNVFGCFYCLLPFLVGTVAFDNSFTQTSHAPAGWGLGVLLLRAGIKFIGVAE